METVKVDVLIVGSGGAALRAAIASKETYPEGNIVIATKGQLGKSGVTANACSDRMAYHATLATTQPGGTDNWRYHADDIYKIGGYVSDRDLAGILAQRSAETVTFLQQLGVAFVKKENGELDQFLTDGSQYPRALYTGPYTAVDIEKALVRKVRALRIPVFEEMTVIKLIVSPQKNRICGAFALDEKRDNAIVTFSTNNIIIATGGAGELYKAHVFTPDNTGSGYAIAYEAGAELTNMEFIQFGPSSSKTKLALSGSFMRAVRRFVNDLNEEFLLKYFLRGFSTEDLINTIFQKGFNWPITSEHMSSLIDIAVYKEIMMGRKVFIDYEQNPENFDFQRLAPELQAYYRKEQVQNLGLERRQEKPLNRLKEINPDAVKWLQDRGLDLEKGEKIQIMPAAQHFQGGVKIREYGNTNIRGLFAVGEAAGGQHGANRPGGNALLDCQVFGKIAGETAATDAQKSLPQEIPETETNKFLAELAEIKEGSGQPASYIRKAIQELMYQGASVVRTEDGLEKALAELEDLKKAAVKCDEKGLVFAVETKLMFSVAEMIIKACKRRKESRGPHLFFENYEAITPRGRDENWEKYIVISKKNGKMHLEIRQPVTEFK